MTDGVKTDSDIQSFFGIDPKLIIPKRFIKVSERGQVAFSMAQLDAMYDDLKKSYHSDYIFNFDKPIITDILDNYMKHIFDYKILYLLANYKDKNKRQSRCDHQYKLLKNTENFITSIVGK